MRTAIIECVVILAAASAAFAGEYHERVRSAEDQAQHATCEAAALDVLTPWPEYEYFRQLAVTLAHDAEVDADRAGVWANAADGWWKEYSDLKVRQATNQPYNADEIRMVFFNYQVCSGRALTIADASLAASRGALDQVWVCRILLGGR
jgi:FlaG/FlaF family flagellin (archaellin)